MSVDYKWANAVMNQLKGCQAENARLREEAAAMTTAIQKVEHLESEIARLKATAAKLWDIAASSIDPPERRRMLDRLGMDSFAEDG